MRYIYFSPHLDDAILSAGGLIFEQARSGIPVEIWTFMAGFPRDDELSDYAKATLMTWGMTSGEESIHIRREEDKMAASLVGAKAVHFDFLDCIFRRSRKGEILYQDVFEAPHQAEADLPAQIAQTMVAWLKPGDLVICQLGVGRHVDHLIVRKAAEMIGYDLLYDADMPYSARSPGELQEMTANMKEDILSVPESSLNSWITAIKTYQTQMASLYDSIGIVHQEVYSYWQMKRGVPLWKFE